MQNQLDNPFKLIPQRSRSYSSGAKSAQLETDLEGNKITIPHHRFLDEDLFESHYTLIKFLGKGSFGKVQLVSNTNGDFACKIIKKKVGRTAAMEQQSREVDILKKVKHKHMINLYEVFESSDKLYCILEYCSGGELIHAMEKKLLSTRTDIRTILKRLTDAIDYLHRHGIVHRDIKPENVLIKSKEDVTDIRLSDFGLATFINACDTIDSSAGTPFYMAPEVLQNIGYSQQCDIWSLGIIAYQMFAGCNGSTRSLLQNMISNKKIDFPLEIWNTVSAEEINLIQDMLQFNPALRITSSEILNHPFITDSFETHQKNVINLMRSYNAEIRFKKIVGISLIVTFWRKICGISAHHTQEEGRVVTKGMRRSSTWNKINEKADVRSRASSVGNSTIKGKITKSNSSSRTPSSEIIPITSPISRRKSGPTAPNTSQSRRSSLNNENSNDAIEIGSHIAVRRHSVINGLTILPTTVQENSSNDTLTDIITKFGIKSDQQDSKNANKRQPGKPPVPISGIATSSKAKTRK